MIYGEGRVLRVRSNDRGACVTGVRMRRVRAVSIGDRTREARADAETAMARAALGEVEFMISVDGKAPRGAGGISSGRPMMAASSDRKNVSAVRRRTL